MAVSADVTISQDGAGNVKLHPYLITLIRWCVSCVWSTASVLLHRLVLAPLPPIKASKQSPKVPKLRQAGTEHLHPEPKVECVVLHTPEEPTLDVIFVHGLYGSLANTWRQGDWRSKYKIDLQKISLRNHTTPCECQTNDKKYNYTYETNLNETNLNETVTFKQINSCFNKILPNENTLITENFYNNTLMDNSLNNYESQAQFVSEMFKNENNNLKMESFDCKLNDDKCKSNLNELNECFCKLNKECKCKLNELKECFCKLNKINECFCKISDEIKLDKCKIGCGCVCEDCYSYCWPKDWIKEDFPGARIISINYTSDPYLWRPLWVKGNKRLRLHERAGQMMEQLINLGVGQRPIIWVGHSKGGLFIKQIYCEAYEAFNKINSRDQNEAKSNNFDNSFNIYSKYITMNNNSEQNTIKFDKNIIFPKYFMNKNGGDTKIYFNSLKVNNNFQFMNENFNFLKYSQNTNTELCGCTKNDEFEMNRQAIDLIDMNEDIKILDLQDRNGRLHDMSLNNEEDMECLRIRSSLWHQSAGFMFYSVPHRGSPLADIKTPITARSIELLEISKDCELVVDLQERWLVATSTSRPVVRSLVETCRTLMSVLWLRIVSVDSADAGVGSLYGVSVDHREICKPSSRTCLLYTELTNLIQTAINRCHCRTKEKHT